MATETRDRRRATSSRRGRPGRPAKVAQNENQTRTGRARRQSSAASRKSSEAQARPLRRVVRRSKRYPEGKCHVCGNPQMQGKVLCENHERQWREGKIRLSRAGAARQAARGNADVTLFLYGEPQKVERPKRRPRKESK